MRKHYNNNFNSSLTMFLTFAIIILSEMFRSAFAPVTNSGRVRSIRKIRDGSVGVSRNRARLNDKLLIISHFTAKCLISKS